MCSTQDIESASAGNLNEDGIVDINKYTLQIISETCPNMDPVTMAVTAVRLINRAKVEVERREELRKMEKRHLHPEKDNNRRGKANYSNQNDREPRNWNNRDPRNVNNRQYRNGYVAYDNKQPIDGYNRHYKRQKKNAYASHGFKRKLPQIYPQGNNAKKIKIN